MRVSFNAMRDYDVEAPVTIEIIKTDNPEVPRCFVALFPDGGEIVVPLSAQSVRFLAIKFRAAAEEQYRDEMELKPDNPFTRIDETSHYRSEG